MPFNNSLFKYINNDFFLETGTYQHIMDLNQQS